VLDQTDGERVLEITTKRPLPTKRTEEIEEKTKTIRAKQYKESATLEKKRVEQ